MLRSCRSPHDISAGLQDREKLKMRPLPRRGGASRRLSGEEAAKAALAITGVL
jgi:hypothetical protein